MKICILSCFEDLTLKDMGPSIRILNLARNLAALGDEIHVIIPKGKSAYEFLDGVAVHGIRGGYPKAILRFLGKLMRVSRPTALFFFDPLFISRACRIIRDCDIVQVEHPSSTGLLAPIISKILRKPLIIDCHDALQALRVEHTSVMRRILETILEKMVYRYASRILTVSEKERACLISWGIGQNNIEVVPNGVDVEAFTRDVDATKVLDLYDLRKCRAVIFVGNINYPPNQEAVQLIASEIAPRVKKEVEDVKFLIVGRIPTRMDLPGLTFTGVVENVAEFLAASDVAIAPLLRGSGTRLKILEYFSCGLPVVSTAVGAEGLRVKDGVHLFIEDNMGQFASRVTSLLQDNATSARLGKNARELVVKMYDWKRLARKLKSVHEKLASSVTITH